MSSKNRKVSRVRMELEGIDEITEIINVLREEIREELKDATKKAARIVLSTALANAPYRTGALKSGIVTYDFNYKTSTKVGVDVMMDRNKSYIYQKEIKHPKTGGRKDAYYPAIMEYGTSKIPAANGGRGFLRPALYDNRTKVKNIIKDQMTKVIRKTWYNP